MGSFFFLTETDAIILFRIKECNAILVEVIMISIRVCFANDVTSPKFFYYIRDVIEWNALHDLLVRCDLDQLLLKRRGVIYNVFLSFS